MLIFFLIWTLCSFLASGNTLPHLCEYWKIGKSTGYTVIEETCEVIWETVKSTHLALPNEEQWKSIANKFAERWNFPHCLGALDGKHIRMQCPPRSGSTFFNYKQYYSIVLIFATQIIYMGRCRKLWCRKLWYIESLSLYFFFSQNSQIYQKI